MGCLGPDMHKHKKGGEELKSTSHANSSIFFNLNGNLHFHTATTIASHSFSFSAGIKNVFSDSENKHVMIL